MRTYEMTYLISDNVPESDLNKVTGKINGYVTTLGGKILKEEIWGRRKLAYPIKKQEFATYVTINFELLAEQTNELERDIRLSSKIIRHLLILKEFGEEALTLSSEDLVDTETIEEVIGEKSFELVEGETEESKDLLAVRDKEKEEEKEEKTEEVKETAEEKAPETKEPKEEKKIKKAAPKKEKKDKALDEADRLSKLDKELDDILSDDNI